MQIGLHVDCSIVDASDEECSSRLRCFMTTYHNLVGQTPKIEYFQVVDRCGECLWHQSRLEQENPLKLEQNRLFQVVLSSSMHVKRRSIVFIS